MNHTEHTSIRKAHSFSVMLTAAALIAVMMGLTACPTEAETSESGGPGSIELTLHFPVSEAITRLNAELQKADGETFSTLEKTEPDFSDEQQPGYKTTTLAFDPVPSGEYLLILTFYRGENVGAIWIEGVTVQPGERSNQWQADDGTLITRTFLSSEFRSTTVAASFTLKNSDGSGVPLAMVDSTSNRWTLAKPSVTNGGIGMQLEISLYGGPGTSLLAVRLNGADIGDSFIPTNGSSPIPVYAGTFDIGTGEALISVKVQAPDRETSVEYTIHQSP